MKEDTKTWINDDKNRLCFGIMFEEVDMGRGPRPGLNLVNQDNAIGGEMYKVLW
jgi:hypothetical protein